MIRLNNISKNYSTSSGTIDALKNINLHVDNGQIYGIIGRSGAGKSTLIRCVNLLEKPTSGEIIVAGKNLLKLNIKQLRHARQQIGMIFQHFNLLSSQTVYENIALPLVLAKYAPTECKKIVNELLEIVELTDKQNYYPSQLSGGQKQRVAIARALCLRPSVLLCDEATSALDPQTTQAVLQLLRHINERFGITILLITHEMDVIKQICDRVAILEQGEIIEETSTSEFFCSPKHPIAQNFVSSTLKYELSDILKQRLYEQTATHCYPIIRIIFKGTKATEPVLMQIIQAYGLGINILQANIEFIKDLPVGYMIAEVTQNMEKLPACIAAFKEPDLSIEILGYVANINQ